MITRVEGASSKQRSASKVAPGGHSVSLVGADAEVKATTTSSRNRNNFCVPDEIRNLASDAV